MKTHFQRLSACAVGFIIAAGAVTSAPAQTFSEFPAGLWPAGIVAGPQGALWFTELHGNKIGRITTTGVVTEFPIPTTSKDPFVIAAGPDRALWFTENYGYFFSKIGRMTTTGVVTEFPFGNVGLWGITTGPDDALWFTESLANKIGRITPAGVITEFPLPPTAGSPSEITAGPDGALWFVGAAKICRITTAGAITEFRIPTESRPQGITVGLDGALWFTESSAGKIGRITTDGVITEFPIPPTSANPYPYVTHIAAGPDGALWFAEPLQDKIGRITTAGVITEFQLPVYSNPVRIAAGPDGAVWFTENTGTGKIGRFALDAQSSSWTTVGTGFFDAGGNSDVLWLTNDRKVGLWLMNGASAPTVARQWAPFGAWVVGTGDFNGDGKADILWRDKSGVLEMWIMNGGTIASTVSNVGGGAAAASWTVASVRDFTGDGKADILWRKTNGETTIWQMDGGGVSANLGPWPTAASRVVAGVGDFNGDGKGDILWRDPNGALEMWLMNGGTIASTVPNIGGAPVALNLSVAGIGDFNGDGKSDILWRHLSGALAIWQMNGGAVSGSFRPPTAAPAWGVAGVDDFNGDGKSDILWRKTDGKIAAWFMNGGTIVTTASFGVSP